jgi:hypothetical protein
VIRSHGQNGRTKFLGHPESTSDSAHSSHACLGRLRTGSSDKVAEFTRRHRMHRTLVLLISCLLLPIVAAGRSCGSQRQPPQRHYGTTESKICDERWRYFQERTEKMSLARRGTTLPATATSRTQSWILSGWGRRGQHLSIERTRPRYRRGPAGRLGHEHKSGTWFQAEREMATLTRKWASVEMGKSMKAGELTVSKPHLQTQARTPAIPSAHEPFTESETRIVRWR